MVRRIILFSGIAIVLLAGLWFVRRPLVIAAKDWRASSLVTKAEKEAAEGRPREAARAATAAWQLGPKRIGVLRRLMDFGRRHGLGDLPAVTLLVYFHDDRTDADREDILEWTLDRRDPAFFDQLYPSLDEANKALPSIRLLHARKLALQGSYLEAIEETRPLQGSGADEDEVSLLLAELLLRLPDNPAAARQARQRLLDLLDDENAETSLRAWRLLALLPENLRDPGGDWDPVAWVAAHPEAGPGDRVAAHRLLVHRLPAEQREAGMDREVRRLLEDPETVSWVVRWYLEESRGEDLLDLPESLFLEDPGIFSSRLQVLLEKERFAEAETWLKQAPKGFPESVAGSLGAVFARRAGRDSEAVTAWQRVIERARSLQLYNDCHSILRIAERFGEEKAAADVVGVIADLPPNRLPPSESLEFLEPRFAGRPEAWREFWKGILRFRPGDPVAIEQVAFLELGENSSSDPAPFLERTEAALHRFPTVPRFRATHALWLMRENRDAEALALLREADLDWNEAEPLARGAYAIALHRHGSVSESAALVSEIPWNRLGPVRRPILVSLLETWRSSPSS